MRKIDFHCHAFPAEFFEALEQIYPGAIELKRDTRGRRFALWANRPLPVWDSNARLKEIDSAGIHIEILSNPPLYTPVDERAPELCRLVNDVLAASCSRAPDRFKALAHLTFNDTGAALNELSRALDQLGCVGVLVTSNIGGRYLDAPEFEPFWAEVNRRGTPVFMHPAISPCYRDHQPATVLSFPFDTTLSAHNCSVRICSRVSPRSRSRWLISAGHCLIGLNGLISRSIRPDFMDPIQNQRRVRAKGCAGFILILHLNWSRGAFECACELVGLDHILSGTDYFLSGTNFMERTCQFIDSIGLKPLDRELIYSTNAARILKIDM